MPSKITRWLRRVVLGPVVKVVARVVEHDVLHEIHAARMQGSREGLVIGQGAQVAIHLLEVVGPIAVIAAVGATGVDPLVGHRWGDPHRRGTKTTDVVQAPQDTAQITSAVVRGATGVVLAGPLVVVSRIAVVKTVGHQKVDDLILPLWRGHMQSAPGAGARRVGNAHAQGHTHRQQRLQQVVGPLRHGKM